MGALMGSVSGKTFICKGGHLWSFIGGYIQAACFKSNLSEEPEVWTAEVSIHCYGECVANRVTDKRMGCIQLHGRAGGCAWA